MYKHEFGIDNLQWLMCHETKQNQTSNSFPMIDSDLCKNHLYVWSKFYGEYNFLPADNSIY